MELKESLSNSEKKVLLALQELGESSPDEIEENGDFSGRVEVMNASSWLQTKKLVSIEEHIERFYALAKKQLEHKDLPERRALKQLKKSNGSLSIAELGKSGKVRPNEIPIAIGWLKRKGWAAIEKRNGETFLVLTEKGKASHNKKGKDEVTIAILAKGEVPETELDQGVIQELKKRQDIIKEREVLSRTIKLTEEGEKIAGSGLEIKKEVSQLEPQMLQTGEWKDVHFRPYDVNAFAPPLMHGKQHPMMAIIEDIRSAFLDMGFTEISGNYVESCFWNMDVLFIPQDHPARELQDTFYLKRKPVDLDPKLVEIIKSMHEGGWKTESQGWNYDWDLEIARRSLLRTHTTVRTIHYLSQNPKPPEKTFIIGRVFRNESLDMTHLPEFYQVDGIIMEEDANFPMLIGILKEFYRRLGFEDVRLRPGYFPYTEPSMEIEVLYQGKWMELGGSGIFRPEVTAPFGIDAPVLAWGLGLERLAMHRLGLKDIRELYISDLKWLREASLLVRD